jgi:hypothetical protein
VQQLNDLNIILGLVHGEAGWPCKVLREGNQDYEAWKSQMQTDAAERKYVPDRSESFLELRSSAMFILRLESSALNQREESEARRVVQFCAPRYKSWDAPRPY